MADVPARALRFMAKTGALAARQGLKTGLRKAATKAAPPMAIVEAAIEVLRAGTAVFEWYAMHNQRNALQAALPQLEETLRFEREVLAAEIANMKTALELQENARSAARKVAKAAQALVRDASQAMMRALADDLPDEDQVAMIGERLEDAWTKLRTTLALVAEL